MNINCPDPTDPTRMVTITCPVAELKVLYTSVFNASFDPPTRLYTPQILTMLKELEEALVPKEIIHY